MKLHRITHRLLDAAGRIRQLAILLLQRLPVSAWAHRRLTLLRRGRLRHESPAAAVSYGAEASAELGTIAESPAVRTGAAAGAGSAAERALIDRIKAETARLNRNNVTRTEAYRVMYGRLPELHWALLAHFVSRSGGWSMTDLKGGLLPALLRPEQRQAVFRMLERANSLIFGDAFPQLLLYEQGKRLGRDLSALLPAFGVSRFMLPVWERFHASPDPAVLTTALIVNEQHYIESRVVRHPYYRRQVLDTLFFGMQARVHLNRILLPYYLPGSGAEADGGKSAGARLRLAGVTMNDFSDLRERVERGRQLYALLFGAHGFSTLIRRFAAQRRHTGSRADYAPHVYTAVRAEPPDGPYANGLPFRRAEAPVYSPRLADAWSDRPVEPAEPGDWFAAAGDVEELISGPCLLPADMDLTDEHWADLRMIRLAAEAAAPGAGGPLP